MRKVRTRISGTVAFACIAVGLGLAGCKEQQAESECEPPLTACGLACVNLKRDPANCGDCRLRCESVSYCSSGVCVPLCNAELVSCGEGKDAHCVDTRTDASNCGGCGVACGADQACIDGACICRNEALATCGTSCSDLVTDSANCGACGESCGPAQQCLRGWCYCVDEDLQKCGDLCIDVASDANNCGRCGLACPGTSTCSGAVCHCSPRPERVVHTARLLRSDQSSLGEPIFGDLTGDGLADLITGTWDAVFLSERTETGYSPATTIYRGQNGEKTLGDVDGDGRLDVIARTRDGLRVLFNRLPASFETGPLLATGHIEAFGAADLDADGSPEIVAQAREGLVVVDPQTGSTKLLHACDQTGWLAMADLDSDGRTDFVYPSLTILWNRDAGFIERKVDLEDSAVSAMTLDVGGDGLLDLVVKHENGGLSLLRQMPKPGPYGTREFVRTASMLGNPRSLWGTSFSDGSATIFGITSDLVTAIDVDKDGHWAARPLGWLAPFPRGSLVSGPNSEVPDIARINRPANVEVTSAVFEPASVRWSALPGLQVLAVGQGDFDGDDIADLVFATTRTAFKCDSGLAQLWLVRGQANGGFGEARLAFSKEGPFNRVAFLPITRPGPGSDLFFALGSGGGQILRYADGAFRSFGFMIAMTETADFDADGHGDLVTGSGIRWGAGNGSFQGVFPLRICGNPVAAGDLDGDGDLDVVSLNGSMLCFHYNEGDRSFETVKYEFESPQFSSREQAFIGDLTGDGLRDVVVLGSSSYWVVKSTGGRSFLPPERFAQSPGENAVAVELDGDGIMDLVSTRGVLFGRNGRFSAPVEIGQSKHANTVLGFDGDGVSEIVALGEGQYWIAEPPACVEVNGVAGAQ